MTKRTKNPLLCIYIRGLSNVIEKRQRRTYHVVRPGFVVLLYTYICIHVFKLYLYINIFYSRLRGPDHGTESG